MNPWTPNAVRAVAGGDWLGSPDETALARPLTGFSTDSRTIKAGEAFIALRGERYDGSAYAGEALRDGAGMAIVQSESESRIETESPGPVLMVGDAHAAMRRLAQAHRATLRRVTVIGVTGSNGKTTTTRMLEAILGAGLNVCASPRSFNNRVGVPLTILRAKSECDALVCEVGANAPGEIVDLASLVRPHIAVITSIGRAHAAGLGGPRQIAREKASLARFLEPGGVVIAPAACESLRGALPNDNEVITFGSDVSAEVRLSGVEHVGSGSAGKLTVHFSIDGLGRFSAPAIGEHNAHNATAAIAAARRLGLDIETIARGLSRMRPPPMRLHRQRLGEIDLFNDAYNASPESTAAAVRTLFSLTSQARRRVIVLGDMLELGEIGPAAHREIGELIASLGGADVFVAVGPLARFAADRLEDVSGAGRVLRVETLDEGSMEQIAGLIEPGDAVLLKGSRRVGLERLAEALTTRASEQCVDG